MKEYSFIAEAGLVTKLAGSGVKALNDAQRHGAVGNFMRGAGTGAAVGAAAGIAKNAMKSGDDPTKKGMMRAALGGASKGATIGGVANASVGALAKTGAGKAMVSQARQGVGQMHLKDAAKAGNENALKFYNLQKANAAKAAQQMAK